MWVDLLRGTGRLLGHLSDMYNRMDYWYGHGYFPEKKPPPPAASSPRHAPPCVDVLEARRPLRTQSEPMLVRFIARDVPGSLAGTTHSRLPPLQPGPWAELEDVVATVESRRESEGVWQEIYARTGQYRGEMRSCRPDGFGRYYNYYQPLEYIGEFRAGLRHGYGKCRTGNDIVLARFVKDEPRGPCRVEDVLAAGMRAGVSRRELLEEHPGLITLSDHVPTEMRVPPPEVDEVRSLATAVRQRGHITPTCDW